MADFKVGANRDLPIDEDSSWDGSAATASVWEWAGGDDFDPAKARQAFLVYDAADPKLRGSYSLPFAAVKGGRLTAYASGIRAAASRLPQKDGLSDAVRNEARAVIDHYLDKVNPDSDEPDADDKERGQELVFALPAPITRLYTSADQPAGSVSEPYATAVKNAVDPSVFDSNPPHFWRAHISNNRVDSYYTRMHSSTLQNYAADATAGVSFQNSHRSTELGFGRSVRGEYLGSPSNGTERTEADFYTIPGLNLNGVSTDDLILGMRAGLVKDVSVGFYGGTFRCATCKRALFTGDCWHVPGLRYDREGKPTDDPEAAPSIAWVHDARLAEVSAVYDGSCPGAAIMKARQVSAAGHLAPEQARLLEARYRIRLPECAHIWQIAPTVSTTTSPNLARAMATGNSNFILASYPPVSTNDKEPLMSDNDGRAAPGSELSTRLRQILQTPEERDPLEHACEVVPRLKAECERLRPLAEELVAAACAEGVRAFGPDFNAETNTAWLATQPFEFVRKQREQWAKQADAVLAGGRTSVDQGEPDPAASPSPNGKAWIPAGAHAG